MMHKFVQWIFSSLINIEKFLRIVCVFFIMLLSLYWIQNLIDASWWWMGFIAPLLEYILDFVNNIYSFSFDFWGKSIEIKYFNALLLMVIIIFVLKAINIGLEKLFALYEDAHALYKKTNEKIFNENLDLLVKIEEKQQNGYMLYIQTKIAKKYLIRNNSIDLKEQNAQLNKIITEKTHTTPIETGEGFVYPLKDFENIDSLLDVLFFIMKSPAPIEYVICLQVGNNTKQLKQLVDLQEWNKIIISADTLCRYNYNNVKKYKTTSVGIFQRKEGTLEVHEIVEKL